MVSTLQGFEKYGSVLRSAQLSGSARQPPAKRAVSVARPLSSPASKYQHKQLVLVAHANVHPRNVSISWRTVHMAEASVLLYATAVTAGIGKARLSELAIQQPWMLRVL